MKNWKNYLVMLLATSSVISCVKQPQEEEEVPTTIDAVQSSLSDAWGHADPLTMTPNDFLFQETEQKLETNPSPFFVLQEGVTVSKKEETDKEWVYTFLYQTKVYKQGQEGAQSTREDHRSVTKKDPALAVTQQARSNAVLKPLADDYQMTLGFERLYNLAYACAKTDSLDKYCKEELKVDSCDITCSNLKVTEQMVPVPDLIKTQPNCGGYASCMYRTKKVAFDWTIALTHNGAVEKQKVNYSVTLSPDMPFLSRMTEYCYRQLVTIPPHDNQAEQKVLVTTCTKLRNFKRGTP